MYRAGISFDRTFFGTNGYRIGSTVISRNTAEEMREKSMKIWNDKYAEKGDLVGFIREWKQELKNEYNIDWDGRIGDYKLSPS